MAEGSETAGYEGLREALLRADRVADFALRLARESGSVPPGLVADFMEARVSMEREFVKCHDRLSPDLRARLKELILKTKNLKPEVMAQGAERLAERIRGVLNDLMIDGGLPLSLTEELFEGSARHATPLPTGEPVRAAPSAPGRLEPVTVPDRSGPGLSVVLALLVLLVLAALAAAWAAGAFSPSPQGTPANEGQVAADSRPAGGQQPVNKPIVELPAAGFDARAFGYTRKLQAQPLSPALDALDPDLDLAVLRASEWPALLLGIEETVERLEPARLKLTPLETARRMRRFAESAESAAPKWIDTRKPFLDAFVAHCRAETQVVLFPEGEQVLASDVLHAKGGPRLPLVLLLCALSQAAGADLLVIAPMGRDFPLLAQQIKAGTATFDGEQLGLRSSPGKEPAVREMLAALCEKLRPTLKTAGARVTVSAVVLRCKGELGFREARDALADLDLSVLAQALAQDPEVQAQQLAQRAAIKLLQPAICKALFDVQARGDAAEAGLLLELALAANDAAAADKALLLLGERAQKGAFYKGEPLAHAVGRKLLARGDKAGAESWFKRAFEEFPDYAPSALELAELTQDAELRRYFLRSAYARGHRAPEFLRRLAELQGQAGEALSALALLDDLCALEQGTAADVASAALLCLGLEQYQWAQERIAASRFKKEAALLRLDLIAELALRGLSDRARELAGAYGKRGQDDPYIESLLQRFGG